MLQKQGISHCGNMFAKRSGWIRGMFAVSKPILTILAEISLLPVVEWKLPKAQRARAAICAFRFP